MTETTAQLCKRQVDRMIDYRKVNRPNDTSSIRVGVSAMDLHKALRPETVRIDHGTDPKTLPVSLLYRGYRVVSIPAENQEKKDKRSG